MTQIRCGRCKQEKDADEFAPSQRKNGSWCRSCFKSKYRETRPAPPAKPCEICQAEIMEPLPKQRFCSPACKMKARYWRMNPAETKSCLSCGDDITRMRRDARYCSDRCALRHRRETGRITRQSRRADMLKSKYGMTVADYDRMLSDQEGGCAICGDDGQAGRWAGLLHVDHCHSTGAVRGLLCESCNLALGKFKDDPRLLRRAAEYIQSHQGS